MFGPRWQRRSEVEHPPLNPISLYSRVVDTQGARLTTIRKNENIHTYTRGMQQGLSVPYRPTNRDEHKFKSDVGSD